MVNFIFLIYEFIKFIIKNLHKYENSTGNIVNLKFLFFTYKNFFKYVFLIEI